MVIDCFGKRRAVEDLQPDDFLQLRESLAKTRGLVALSNEIGRVRAIFNFAWKNCHIDRPVRFGDRFRKPSRRSLRKQRSENAVKLHSHETIHKLLKVASPQMQAMIYLGINCGFGNDDCSELRKKHLDLEKQWIDFPRPKTGIERRCPLWNETAKAIREAIAVRPSPKDDSDDDRVVLTKYGQPWTKKDSSTNPVSQEFRKLLVSIGEYRKGVGFYALQHSFRTIADGAKDQPAVRLIMGHVDESIDDKYRESIEDERLIAVSEFVHAKLFFHTQS